MLAYLLAALVVVVAALAAFGIAALMHLQGAAYAIFVTVILLLGIGAAVAIVLYFRAKKKSEAPPLAAGSGTDLDLMLNDANRKLRTSQLGAKTLEALPLIYILGDQGVAKSTLVIRSGLDPELLAGSAAPDTELAPTAILNLWFTQKAALLEVGSSVREDNALFGHLVHRTRAKAIRSAFGAGAAPRAAIVCLSIEQLLVADNGESLMASARANGARLRELTRILGMPVPVYVIITKLDRVPHFEQYVHNLSEDEVLQIVGTTLPRTEATVGTYADQASRTIAGVVDSIVFQFGEHRVEMLDRENDPRNAPGVYEFPREFGKLRKNLNQYLVELCKPSQLSANPYLRGFYFTGVRARTVERAVAAPVAMERPPQADAGATQYISRSMGQGQVPARAPVSPAMVSSRVPQWTFLPRLLREVVLGDDSAFAATRQSAPARLFRRILFGALAVLLAIYCVLLLVSYLNNAALEHRIANAAHALPAADANSSSVPDLGQLRALDDLRQTIAQLDGYEKNGAPLSYRFGLYQGNKLNAQAHKVYFDRFRPLMLNPAQANLAAYLRTLPDAPSTSNDFTLYNAAYNPLKAYLITTDHPEKSQVSFLTPVFLQYWLGSRPVEAEQQDLARKQIDFYGSELLRQPPYSIPSDSGVVSHAQTYLSKFLGATRIYQGMLADADHTNAAVDFNRQYPGSATYVQDGYVVRGAFTKTGYDFMQNAIPHPEKYAAGEKWVLGEQAGQSLNMPQISSDLATQYTTDFLKEWHSFLSNAHVTGCGTLKEAPDRLNALAGPASPLLELFFVVSHNTAVANAQIKSTFQPAQVLVDPNATDRLIGPGNAPYMTALTQLAAAVALAAQAPDATTNAATFAPVSQQAAMTDSAARQIAQGFNVDQQTHTESVVLSLLQAPIKCISALAPSPGAPAAAGGQKICGAISPLLAKFPFANNSTVPAGLPEVDAVFAPDTGAIWTALNGPLKSFLVQQGTQFNPSPTAPSPLNPRFVDYFRRMARISADLYPAGQKSATLTFTLRSLPGSGVSSATFVVDGQRIPAGSTTQQFTWNGATAQHASLVVDEKEVLPLQGTWSVFSLVRAANHITKTAGGYRLEYPISLTVAGHNVPGASNAAQTAIFEISGPGAELLVADGLSGLNCVAAVNK